MNKIGELIKKHTLLFCIIIGFIISFINELLGRASLLETAKFILDKPLMFTYNALIVAATVSIACLFSKKYFTMIVISTIWLAIGITNGIILSNRVTPFTFVDLKLITDGIKVLPTYMSPFQIGAIIVGIVSVIALLIFLWIKLPKHENDIHHKKNSRLVALFLVSFAIITTYCLKTGVLSTQFTSLVYAYEDYGVEYSFSATLLNTGMNKPKGYTEEKVNSIMDDVKNNTTETNSNNPNIIMVQLESLFDPTHVTDLHFSEDPIPFLRSLRQNYTSGFLSVPGIGAGTANTEFEVMTGMDLDFFGTGEYPYKTILTKTTSESLAYDLKDLGYSAHAIHNNTATFYSRNKVFAQLGYDTFTSKEFMNIQEWTPNGWAKDKILTGEIMKVLESTENQDYIYTISVQGHGSYSNEPNPDNKIKVTSDIDRENINAIEYYVNQIHEMDQFVQDLVNTINSFDEDTVVVFYGDHLPSLGIEKEHLDNGSIYQTEYIAYSNFDMEKQNVDLEAYQLSSYILDRVGIHHGTLPTFHQTNMGKEDYLTNLEILQYDMLYGKHFSQGGENPYTATDLKLGIYDVTIESIENSDNLPKVQTDDAEENDSTVTEEPTSGIIVKGQHFTDRTKIYINDELVKTQFIDSETVIAKNKQLQSGDVVNVIQQGTKKVLQQGSKNRSLATSNEMTYIDETEENNVEN